MMPVVSVIMNETRRTVERAKAELICAASWSEDTEREAKAWVTLPRIWTLSLTSCMLVAFNCEKSRQIL